MTKSRADGLLTLTEYLAATKPKRKKGVDPALSAKARANAAASLAKARQFAQYCKASRGPLAVPEPTLEYQPRQDRKHRMDICWPEHKLALEIEGGTWKGGRFNMEKANLAALAGYRIIYVTPAQLLKPETLALVIAAIHGEEGER